MVSIFYTLYDAERELYLYHNVNDIDCAKYCSKLVEVDDDNQ